MGNKKNRSFEETLSIEEQEILCSLDVSAPPAKVFQRQLSQRLSVLFAEGDENIARDQWKAAKYGNYALEKPVTTAKVYTTLGIFTSTRLFLVRINRLNKLGHRLFFVLGSLSNILEFITDLCMILKTTFFPQSAKEKLLTKTQRFKNALRKDNRPIRMANAAIWFTINLVTFIITGGMSFYLNLVGFIFDSAIEIYKNVILNVHSNLLKKVNKQIHDLDLKMTELKNSLVLSSPKHHGEISRTLTELKKEREILLHYPAILKEKIQAERSKRLFNAVMQILCCIGSLIFLAALICNPPAGLVTAGAVIALVTGSILTGFTPRIVNILISHGKALINKIKQWFPTKQLEEENLLDYPREMPMLPVRPRALSVPVASKPPVLVPLLSATSFSLFSHAEQKPAPISSRRHSAPAANCDNFHSLQPKKN